MDVLRHHPSPRGSGDHRRRSYPAMEEVTVEHGPKTEDLGGIYTYIVFMFVQSV